MSLELCQSPPEINLAGSDSVDISIKLPVRVCAHTPAHEYVHRHVSISCCMTSSIGLTLQLLAVQVAEMDAFTCHAAKVYNTYKYKLVRAAFANLPTLKDPANHIKSKVRPPRCCCSCSSSPSTRVLLCR